MAINNDYKMGDTQQTLWDEIIQGISKFIWYIFYISIGVIVKITLESRTVKLSKKLIALKVVLSICAGALASIICTKWGLQKWDMIIVPTATLIGEGVFGYIMTNWKRVADYFIGRFTKQNNKS